MTFLNPSSLDDYIYISSEAYDEVKNYIRSKGFNLIEVSEKGAVQEPVSSHADLFYCNLGGPFARNIIRADLSYIKPKYPEEASYCGLSTGKYFIHNLKITAPPLLKEVRKAGLIEVNVKQGYTKCSVIPISETKIITTDSGIKKACDKLPDLKCLLVSGNNISLKGYNRGFIGGTCGILGDELIFNGDISSHEDFFKIKAFAESSGLKITGFENLPLHDIGSIV